MHKLFSFILTVLIITACSSTVTKDIRIQELDYPEDLNVIKRADWGWVPMDSTIAEQHKIDKITIHHGGVEFTKEEDAAQSVRNLQSWSRSEKNWIDIPYHFMIDLDGNIYEARPINYPGATNTEYDPTNHALIEVMGNYEIQIINQKQLNALINLTAFLVEEFDVPLENIKGHKDYSKITDCPGKDLYKYLQDGTIVNKVSERISKGDD